MADRESRTGPTAKVGTKRKRPWLRRVGVVVGCLLAGAIINVLVAWGCALGSELESCHSISDHEAKRLFAEFELPADPRAVQWAAGRPLRLDWGIVAGVARGFGRRDVVFDDEIWGRSISMEFHILQHRGEAGVIRQSGWPFLSMQGSSGSGLIALGKPREERAGGMSSGYLSSVDIKVNPSLPLWPIWPGFLINTVFYGAIAWMLFATPRAVRRHRRVKRRLCPDCGYDLRGADHDVCPECGN